MTPERWKHTMQVLNQALERDPRDRAGFLANACADDDALHREVESLLAAHEQAGDFLEMESLSIKLDPRPPIRQRLAVGTRIGVYEVLALIGAGGMGQVYRARDTMLDRDVALKILSDALCEDKEHIRRFEREAKLLASLNHPNIATIYHVEESNGIRCLILEYVEGETLAARLRRGPVPLAEAITLCRQIAEALETAHEHGIVHRDLKPANVQITAGGGVKVLDFGIAKLLDKPGSSTSADTLGTGGVIGTPSYMSPEQARGISTDRRTDIWAFGCVLYEVLTGRHAFQKETRTDTLAAILHSEPDWEAVPSSTLAKIRDLLRRCLQKDVQRRLRDIGDARIELEDMESARQTGNQSVQDVIRRRRRSPWIAAALMSMLIAAVVLTWLFRPGMPGQEMRLDITTPPTTDPGSVSLAISPDGRKLVFVAISEGRPRLWLRWLNSDSSRLLPATEGAKYPFWSPDSRSVGFFSEDKLKRIDIDSGSVTTLAPAHIGDGGTWNRDGVILFSQAPKMRIFRIGPSGGEPAILTQLVELPGSHRFPQFLPDGRHFLYYVYASPEISGVYIGQVDRSETRRLLSADSAAVYASSGHLLFVRQGTLFAQKFDPVRLELTGDPAPVVEKITVGTRQGSVALSASAAGPIAYRGGAANQDQLEWFDRSGNPTGKLPFVGSAPSISPDGRFVALQGFKDGNFDVWLVETARDSVTRFTSDPADDAQPTWSPDSSSIVFASSRKGQFNLYQKSINGALGSEELLFQTPESKLLPQWSPDGRFLLYRNLDSKTMKYDIWAWPFEGDHKPFVVVRTDFDEREGRFSPDGKWIAYQSDESGHYEIYIRPFPGPGTKFGPISTNGGVQVQWRGDGKELYYLTLDNRLMAVPIQLSSNGQTVLALAPVQLFVTRVAGGGPVQANPQYTVSPDGKRFLIHTAAQETTTPITVILNLNPKP